MLLFVHCGSDATDGKLAYFFTVGHCVYLAINNVLGAPRVLFLHSMMIVGVAVF